MTPAPARMLMNMTRENKLALVIGFGLVLFVGILISDHFSTAQNQESADLVSARGGGTTSADQRRRDPQLLEAPRASEERARFTPSPTLMGTGELRTAEADDRESQRGRESERNRQSERDDRASRSDESERIVIGGQNGRTSRDNDSRRAESPVRFHDVRSGESLGAIARQYYGDESLYRQLAEFNDISNPNLVPAGRRLRIPVVEVLRGEAPAPSATESPRRAPEPAYTSYTIQRGDTLSKIAQRLLGSAQRWREIYELNRDVINDADNVPLGAEIRIPRP
ncbi:MAG: LysM peptidoglycan-binding domain-containing protein [Phycisphaerales bacterium]|nr:MAG: LysM peptidoglycan-binding domain-containing protein [Phycisphaerales bacterium]